MNDKRQYKIYVLKDPRTQEIRYVGVLFYKVEDIV